MTQLTKEGTIFIIAPFAQCHDSTVICSDSARAELWYATNCRLRSSFLKRRLQRIFITTLASWQPLCSALLLPRRWHFPEHVSQKSLQSAPAVGSHGRSVGPEPGVTYVTYYALTDWLWTLRGFCEGSTIHSVAWARSYLFLHSSLTSDKHCMSRNKKRNKFWSMGVQGWSRYTYVLHYNLYSTSTYSWRSATAHTLLPHQEAFTKTPEPLCFADGWA